MTGPSRSFEAVPQLCGGIARFLAWGGGTHSLAPVNVGGWFYRRRMSTALWNDLAPAPRPAGWGAATHVAAGLWRIADPRGIVVGHIRAIAADGGWRYAAERFHTASGSFRRLGEFWSSADAVECLRYLR